MLSELDKIMSRAGAAPRWMNQIAAHDRRGGRPPTQSPIVKLCADAVRDIQLLEKNAMATARVLSATAARDVSRRLNATLNAIIRAVSSLDEIHDERVRKACHAVLELRAKNSE